MSITRRGFLESAVVASLATGLNAQDKSKRSQTPEPSFTVCDRWLNSFENFLADMGRRPSVNYSIDRIKNDGNYEPGNCRWATAKEQRNNQGHRHVA